MKAEEFLILNNDSDFRLSKSGMYVSDMMKKYALEIAKNAFDEGFAYGISSYNAMKQNYLSKSEYLQKLKNEI